MTIAGILDRPYDSDIDVRFVAQVSAIGSLADDVLGDLIRADSDFTNLKSSQSIAEAAALFQLAAESTARPASLWKGGGLSEALRRMAAITIPRESEGPTFYDGVWSDRLNSLADALSAAAKGMATEKQIDLVRSDFDVIARSTMETTLASMHTRGFSTSWLTA